MQKLHEKITIINLQFEMRTKISFDFSDMLWEYFDINRVINQQGAILCKIIQLDFERR